MRSPIVAVALVVLSLASAARAEDRPPPASVDPGVRAADRPRNLVLADLGLHVIGLGYQRTLASRLAVQIDADFYAPWTSEKEATALLGAVVRARAFYYPLGGAPAGLWLSPFAQYGVGWALHGGERHTTSLGAAGASVGYSLLLARRFLVALGVGGQYQAARVLGIDGAPGFAGFHPTVDVNVGYAF